MRCEECGRPIRNAQMWQLGGDPHAPHARSLRQLCWSCLERENEATQIRANPVVIAQAEEVLRDYQASNA